MYRYLHQHRKSPSFSRDSSCSLQISQPRSPPPATDSRGCTVAEG